MTAPAKPRKPRTPTVTQAKVARAIRALTDEGLTVARIELAPSGAVAVVVGPPATAQPLTAPAPGVTPASLDDWRARKNGHRAHQGA